MVQFCVGTTRRRRSVSINPNAWSGCNLVGAHWKVALSVCLLHCRFQVDFQVHSTCAVLQLTIYSKIQLGIYYYATKPQIIHKAHSSEYFSIIIFQSSTHLCQTQFILPKSSCFAKLILFCQNQNFVIHLAQLVLNLSWVVMNLYPNAFHFAQIGFNLIKIISKCIKLSSQYYVCACFSAFGWNG